MNLPGWVFMILGTAVVAYSQFVQNKNGSNLLFFTVIGGLFIIYGLGKEAMNRFRAKANKKIKAKPPQQNLARQDHRHPAGNQMHGKSNHEQHAHIKPHKQHSYPYKPAHKQCPQCKTTTVSDASFCHRCGFQF